MDHYASHKARHTAALDGHRPTWIEAKRAAIEHLLDL